MRRPAHPPRMAAWLVARSVSTLERGQLLGDLAEQFHRRQERGGAPSATRWYWTQAAGLVLALGSRRLAGGLIRIVAPDTGRAALRSLYRSPGSSLASIVILAVGVAAPVSMFALADGSVRSLPEDPDDRIVRVSRIDREGRVVMGLPWELYETWSGAVESGGALVDVGAFSSLGTAAVGDGASPAGRFWAAAMTPEIFRMLDVSPRLGRVYGDAERGGLPQALIREDLWEERFDREPTVLGRVLRIEGIDHRIVGVLPRAFAFPIDHQVWMQPVSYVDRPWSIVGRLTPLAPPGVAAEQLEAVAASAPPAADDGGEPTRLHVEAYTVAHLTYDSGDEVSRGVGRLTLILLVLTALNVAAVMLARGIARTRETSIRMALGASRFQVMALTLTESALLCLAGGLLGLALGRFALEVMAQYLISQVTIEPYWVGFGLDGTSVAQAAGLVLVAGAVSGVLPGLHATRMGRGEGLRASPGVTSRGTLRALTLLVGAQATLSCFLLTMAGQAVAEARTQLEYGHDFPADGLLTARVALDPLEYPDGAPRATFMSELLTSLGEDPAVDVATWTSALPGKDGIVRRVGVTGSTDDAPPPVPAQLRSVDAAFLGAMDARVLSGRDFTTADDVSSEPTAIVNEAFARRHGIAGSAVGRTLAIDRLVGDSVHTARIVGVIDDRGITPNLRGRPIPGVYLPMRQALPPAGYVLTRTLQTTPLTDVWNRSVWTLDPYLPLGEVLTLQEQLRRGHALPTLLESVFTALGVSTLLVALVGLYGLHAFSLSQRVRELGLRRALGGHVRQLAWEGMRRGLRPVAVGMIVGTVPAVFVARALLPQQLHAVALLLGPGLLVLSATLAIWRPTWNASRTDPMEGLREA